uniref:Mu-diguetoxin-Dc1b n=1 Tax=Diguetia canities TaxID=38407 RepID=TXI11_DIGCA|nr:RecName: Full=Mu-diguetoxin-Dc1b; Short=Mu-DGTX-Dc1b; AltName: Full=Insecticidal toxin DTX11 [Diguetia canities]
AKDGDVKGPAGCMKYKSGDCRGKTCCDQQYLWYKWRNLACRCFTVEVFKKDCWCNDIS